MSTYRVGGAPTVYLSLSAARTERDHLFVDTGVVAGIEEVPEYDEDDQNQLSAACLAAIQNPPKQLRTCGRHERTTRGTRLHPNPQAVDSAKRHAPQRVWCDCDHLGHRGLVIVRLDRNQIANRT